MGFLQRLFGGKKQSETKPETDKQPPDTPPVVDEGEDFDPKATQPILEETRPIATRQLDPPKAYKSTHKHARYGIASDVGKVRTNNQDACGVFLSSTEMTGNPPFLGLFMVADGMGGHHDGELASAVTVQVMTSYVMQEIIIPHLEGRQQGADTKPIPEILSDAMNAANQEVQVQVPNGGTTATVVLLRGDLAFISHVGDSRAYLFAEGNLELLTRDHSLVRRLQELGQLSAEEAEVHPQRNVLYRAIGQGDTIEIDPTTRRLVPGSRVLLCSDGLWGVIGDEAIERIMSEESDPQAACEKMVELANEGGGHDNITAVMLEMPE